MEAFGIHTDFEGSSGLQTTAGQVTLWGNLLNTFRSQLESEGVCFVFLKGEALNAYIPE